MQRRLQGIAIILLIASTTLIGKTESTYAGKSDVLQWLKDVAHEVLTSMAANEISDRWGEQNNDINILRNDLKRLERLITRGHSTGEPCKTQEADSYLACMFELIRSSYEAKKINEVQLELFAEAIAEVVQLNAKLPPLTPKAKEPNGSPIPPDQPDTITVSANLGETYVCERSVDPTGTFRVGLRMKGARVGTWIEVTPSSTTVQLNFYEKGKLISRKGAYKKSLPITKRNLVERFYIGEVDQKNLAHGYGVIVYKRRGEHFWNLYYGRFKRKRRNGVGCYFGAINVFPRCYKNGARLKTIKHPNPKYVTACNSRS